MANTPIVIEQEGRPLTTSRAVAEQFERQHKHVLRNIEKLSVVGLTYEEYLTTSELRVLNNKSTGPKVVRLTEEQYLKRKSFFEENFQITNYMDEKGEERQMYLMTKEGFSALAMGFTGDRAYDFKIDYIHAFKRMEAMLKTGVSSIALQNIEKRLEALESTAGEGKHDANEAIVHSFLQALKMALDSGEYYLEKKHAIKPEKPSHGEYLGYYDEFLITLQSMPAYKIYERATPNPLKYKTFWDIVYMAGVIKARTTRADRKRNFRGQQVSSVQIYKNKAPMIRCGGPKR